MIKNETQWKAFDTQAAANNGTAASFLSLLHHPPTHLSALYYHHHHQQQQQHGAVIAKGRYQEGAKICILALIASIVLEPVASDSQIAWMSHHELGHGANHG
jgi:hypothetical protein